MRIGVGVISYQRPEHLDLWKEQVLKYSPKDIEMSIYLDEPERRGIAYGKNQNLKDLKHCDYIFLMDSDCFPIKSGWIDFFIDASKASGQQHFLYLKETQTIKKTGSRPFLLAEPLSKDFTGFKIDNKTTCFNINIYDNCGGCFMFLTKEVIEKVGGYCKDYGLYGYEHAGYSERIHGAGLTPLGKYTCPAGAGEYIYAMDYDFHRRDEFQKKVNHQPSMPPKEMIEEQQKNYSIYLKESQHIFQSL